MSVQAYRIAAVLAAALSTSQAGAADWSGRLEVGAVATSGNSETSTLNAAFGVARASGAWTAKARAVAIQTSKDGDATAERYEAGLRAERNFGDANYWFANADYEKDLFGGVRERTTETLGYGRRLLKTASQVLDLELGAGARQQKAQLVSAQRESRVVGRSALHYVWTISPSSAFSQDLKIEGGEDNVYSESVTRLKLSILGRVYANLGFTVKNNSRVPVDAENTDTISSVTLSYEFGG